MCNINYIDGIKGRARAVLSALVLMVCAFTSQALEIRSLKFNTSNGLTDNTVRDIYQDSRGYIWFATFYGLSRYDGYNIAKYTPADGRLPIQEAQIRKLMEDSHGYMWLLCNNDVIGCLDLNTDMYVNFLPDDTKRYRYVSELADGTVWLYGEHGALRVTHTPDGLVCEVIDDGSHGLSSSNIITIEQDNRGRVLLSTVAGLYAYADGSVSSIDNQRQYQWMQKADRGVLMIATNGELVKLDESGKLKVLDTIEGVATRNDLPGHYVYSGKWYISSRTGGRTVDLANDRVTLIDKNIDIPAWKSIIDNRGGVWLHNESGYLYFVDHGRGKLIRLHLIPDETIKFIDSERYSVTRDRKNRAWITTSGNGLYIYDFSSGNLEHITADAGGYHILPSDNLLHAIADNQDNVWVGTEYSGAVMLKPNNREVTPLDLPDAGNGDQSVRMIKRLPNGAVLVSRKDGNLYKFSPDLQEYEVKHLDAVIYDAIATPTGDIIEATRSRGLFINGVKNDDFDTSSDNLFSVYRDRKGRIWVGTFGAGMDVFVPDSNGKILKRNFLNANYAQRRVRTIYQDKSGNIWAGTNAGAYRFDPEALLSGDDHGVLYDVASGVLTTNEVHCIIQDYKGRIWIGESGNGISILDFSNGDDSPDVTHITTELGLGNNNVSDFVKENDDYIWATTQYGLARIDTRTLRTESFVLQSNPSANVYNPNSAIFLDDGRMLLGSNTGAYMADVSKLSLQQPKSPITVTALRVNGEDLGFVADGNLVKKKESKYQLRLPYDKNNIDLELSTFDFEMPKATKFRYRLSPVDKQWGAVTVDNRIPLKNLSPGRYTLIAEVSGTAVDEWDKRMEIDIVIDKPWWASWYAKIVYALLVLLGIYLVYRVANRMNQLHNKIKVEEQLVDYKLEFFTNISHEFRTPLTLIQVSLEKLHEKLLVMKEQHPSMSLGSLNMPLSTLDKNTRRMSRLIDELLTFRKVEKNKMVLYPEPTEVIGFLREAYDNFQEEAQSKHIGDSFTTGISEFVMNVDRNALDKIVNNLISNAIKYTREGGKVSCDVNVDSKRGKLVIKVSDNGVGIDPDKREQLFTRFMQSAMSRNSIGVGLHLAFGLVQLSKGEITHADNPGGGSIFTVELPTDLPASESRPEEGIGRPSFDAIFKETDIDRSIPSTDSVEGDVHKKKMLIIDDDADIRSFLSREFSRYFHVLTASDGHSGLDAARNNDVNIVICDVMMPDMSGFEVTRLLKEDFATSHIPIIQLTALSNDDCQIEGITSGADAYVTKPFNLKYLKTRVAKLIEQRENLFSKFSASPTLARPQLPMGDKDKEFADRLAEIVDKQLDNSEFTVDDFAAEMALGRTIFFRKVKGVTGYSPKEYLRVMRMKKAAELLLSTDLTISEVAYHVGISDSAYFNKCFKAQFGKAPSVYQRENTSQDTAKG